MAKVTFIQVVYNNRRFIEPVFSAMFAQTFKDFNVVAVISGNEDGSKELIAEKFPQVEIIDPGYNIGFAKGHNLVFEKYDSEFFQLVNPDLIMEPDYVERLLETFHDPRVGAATGKLYKISNFQFPVPNESKTNILDTTGVIINKSGSARDRGQHEEDKGQYDGDINVQAVSAAGAMYRRSALMKTRLPKSANQDLVSSRTSASEIRDPGIRGWIPDNQSDALMVSGMTNTFEYFDEDFHSYWEDVDLAWRMSNAGWKCSYNPKAVAYHGRGAGSHKGGYKKVFSYISYHKTLSPWVRQLNYQNHIFMYIKNSPWFYPQFFIREFFMFCYIALFEPGTLKVIPKMLATLPIMWEKRRYK